MLIEILNLSHIAAASVYWYKSLWKMQYLLKLSLLIHYDCNFMGIPQKFVQIFTRILVLSINSTIYSSQKTGNYPKYPPTIERINCVRITQWYTMQ